jgi:hypothetical protein
MKLLILGENQKVAQNFAIFGLFVLFIKSQWAFEVAKLVNSILLYSDNVYF